jgi:uncharacterized protein DUF4159
MPETPVEPSGVVSAKLMNISFPAFDLAKEKPRGILLVAFLALFFAIAAVAQRTAREADPKRMATPDWTLDPRFKRDVFTFARIKYSVDGTYGWGHTLERWAIDFPDSDLNFSYRLQQVTSIKANPEGHVLELTDKELFDYPFIYIVEPGRLTFQEKEIPILRKYLLNGGFLMLDDFWGDREWSNFYREIKKVFPDREPIDLPLNHPIFHTVFDLKEKPQVPGLPHVIAPGWDGRTYEANHGSGAEQVHYRAILDDKGRIMVMICHNTDLGDGWEQEGFNELYFREFSEKKAYPMGINIIVYAMTH